MAARLGEGLVVPVGMESRKIVRRAGATIAALVLVLSSCGDNSSSSLSFRVEQLSPEQVIQLTSGSIVNPGGIVLSRSGEDLLIGILYGECNGVYAHVDAVHLDKGTLIVTISPPPEGSGPQAACAGIGRNDGVRLTIPATTTIRGVEVRYKR